jgi:hypothetical protein
MIKAAVAKKGKISLIFFEDLRSPRYFEINKKHLKFLFVGLPIICLIIIAILLIGVLYFNQIKASILRKEPIVIKELRTKNLKLTEKNAEINKFNKILQNKLSSGLTTPLSSLGFFYPITAQQDLTHTPYIAIENYNYQFQENNLSVSFSLANLSSEGTKQAGYIFTFLKTNNGIMVYPESALPEEEFQMKFNRGEYFSFSRFRPVTATFNLNQKVDNFLIKVLVFSRTGDLILRKMFLKEVNK